MNSLILPPYLHEGDKVAIVSPSSKIDKSFLKGAKKRLESWGLKVIMGKHAGSASGRYAGTVKQRLSDLQSMMNDPEIKAIFCSRGGYGAVHLVQALDFTLFRESPKWLIGFSDITALHNLIQSNGFASLHAPMARHLTVEPEDDPFSASEKYSKRHVTGILLSETQIEPPGNRPGDSERGEYGRILRIARHSLRHSARRQHSVYRRHQRTPACHRAYDV